LQGFTSGYVVAFGRRPIPGPAAGLEAVQALPILRGTGRHSARNAQVPPLGRRWEAAFLVFAEHSKDSALNGDLGGGNEDGVHLDIRRLKPDDGAFAVIALQGGLRTAHQGDNDFAGAGRRGAFDEDEVAVKDVLVAHGLAADLEGEDVAIADNVGQRNGLGVFNGFDGITGGNAAGQDQAVDAAAFGARRQDVERAAAIVRAGEEAFVLQVSDVLVHGSEGAKVETAGNFFEGWGIAVSLHKAGDELEHFLLPPGDRHSGHYSEQKANG